MCPPFRVRLDYLRLLNPRYPLVQSLVPQLQLGNVTCRPGSAWHRLQAGLHPVHPPQPGGSQAGQVLILAGPAPPAGGMSGTRAALAGGASWLGVISADEALALRAAGLTAPVLCLMGVPGAQHAEAIRRDVDLSASTAGLGRGVAAAARPAGRCGR